MQKSSFCIGFYSVCSPSTFSQKAKKTYMCRQNGGCFSGGLSAPLFRQFWVPTCSKNESRIFKKTWSAGLPNCSWKTCAEKVRTCLKSDPKMRSRKVIFLTFLKGLGPRVPQGGPKDPPRAPKVTPKVPKATPKLPKWSLKAPKHRQKIGENGFENLSWNLLD